METKYLNLQQDKKTSLKMAGQAIQNNGLVIFPTETVYGIGANGLNSEAVAKIFIAKGRNPNNPLILHISDFNMLDTITQNISTLEYKLMKTFWPGPFTIILPRKKIVPNNVTANLETVGVRMPNNNIALNLIKEANVPIAAPSANLSGKPSGTNIKDIFDEFNGKVDYILDNGDCLIGLESTVVRVIDNVPHILRPGKITPEQIKKIAGCVQIDKHILGKYTSNEPVASPGMKFRHYAPKTKCKLFYSNNNDSLIKTIQEFANKNGINNTLIISSKENVSKYNANTILDIGSKNNLDEISKNIFTTLRKVDKYNVNLVLIEGVKAEGLGLAIMNRLIRACEYNYIEC